MKNNNHAPFITIVMILVAASLLLAAGCGTDKTTAAQKKAAAQEKPFYYCESDSDCICDGVDEERQSCFIGNKDYYEAYVNKDRECPAAEFCKGTEGNLVIKCIANHCMQMPECGFDAECGGGRCVENKCVKA